MILIDNILVLSYVPYGYKEGGFCIYIKPNNKVVQSELFLKKEEIKELQKVRFVYKNRTPDYKELINEYFDNLETDFI